MGVCIILAELTSILWHAHAVIIIVQCERNLRQIWKSAQSFQRCREYSAIILGGVANVNSVAVRAGNPIARRIITS